MHKISFYFRLILYVFNIFEFFKLFFKNFHTIFTFEFYNIDILNEAFKEPC